jgi:RNA polymerase sigma-70 factor (ECF subfamily)
MKFYTQKIIFEHWLKYQTNIKKYIRRFVSNEDTVNEILHMSMMKVSKSCCSGCNINNVEGWVKRIAYNCMLEELKHNRITTDLIPEFEDEQEDNNLKEIDSIIKPLIDSLPEKYSLPLIMADIQKMKQIDIASELGLSVPTTKSRIQRARQQLQIVIQECCHVERDELDKLLITPKDTCIILKSCCD